VSREALSAAPDWSVIAWRGGALVVLAVVMSWLATKAFGAYQKSI
jgi:ABC-2 type transport system permease protein